MLTIRTIDRDSSKRRKPPRVSPHVVQMFDHGGDDCMRWMAMERLYGEDLHDRLEKVKRLPIAEVGKIVFGVGAALRVAHAAGITHRDIKPRNIFLANDGDTEVVKLLDFGVAKCANPLRVATAQGVSLGSPFYMSPEQIRCDPTIDARSDIWSFSAVLYRVPTGHTVRSTAILRI